MKLAALAAAAAVAGPFYADPDSNAERQARSTRTRAGPRRAAHARARRVPQAFWFTGGTPKQVRRQVDRTVDAATQAQAVPVLVAYNVPGRDCGGYSAGGAQRDYRRWIDGFADGIKRPPGGRDPRARRARSGCVQALGHLRRAVDAAARGCRARRSTSTPATRAGSPRRRWRVGSDGSARDGLRPQRLQLPRHRRDRRLRHRLSNRLNGTHFVIDTSRNGRGPERGDAEWCNPPGRGLGARPTTDDRQPAGRRLPVDQDPRRVRRRVRGRNDPQAGRWWPRYALGLARRANPPLPSAARARSRGRRRAGARDRRRAAAGRRPPRAGPAAAAR